jgi:hypothetical protein
LRQKDYLNGLKTLYDFLKQERIDAESLNKDEEARHLKEIEKETEEFIVQAG